MLSKTFAERLKQARDEKGLAQIDIAQAMGVRGSATVHRWEAGISFPGLDVVDRLAEMLDKPVLYFFTPKDDELTARKHGYSDVKHPALILEGEDALHRLQGRSSRTRPSESKLRRAVTGSGTKLNAA